MSNSRFYWLKLKRDFFKRSDIKIIENMPNGKDYVLFYLKLLLESIEHNGSLRFSDTIPYDEAMLSTITDTNIDIVRAAMKVLTSTGLIEVMADDTIFMSEVQSMIGVASQDEHTRESTRLRVQTYRERKRQALIEDGCYSNVTCNGEIELEKDIDKELDKDISPKVDISLEKENIQKKKKSRFVPPTVEEVRAYCLERHNNIDPQMFVDFYASKNWMVGKTKMSDWKASVRTWERNSNKRQQTSNNSNKTCFGEMMEREGVDPKEIIYGKSGDFNFT